MKKIIIIGSPGAGKSTFARKLQEIINLPLYHLDLIWHKADRTEITREEFDNILDEILNKDEWIVDGNYQRTIEIRLKKCDTVFLLDYPTEVCLSGAKSRVGIKSSDMPWTEESLDKEFEQRIINFSTNNLPKIYELLNKYKKDKEIIVFKNREETEEYINNLTKI